MNSLSHPPVRGSSALRRLLHPWSGVWRLTWRPWLAPAQLWIVSLVVVGLGLLTVAVVPAGHASQYHEWLTSIYLLALVPVAAFLQGAGALREDLGSTTTDYVLTRPIRRATYLAFRYIAQWLCAQLIGVLAWAALLLAGGWREIPDWGAAAGPLLLAQVMAITAFLALGFCCAALTSRYLVLGLCYGAVIEVGVGQIPIQLNRLSILHHLRVLVHDLGAGGVAVGGGVVPALGLLTLIAVAFWAVAALVLTWRELVGEEARET